jgi:hypothetical protein
VVLRYPDIKIREVQRRTVPASGNIDESQGNKCSEHLSHREMLNLSHVTWGR